MARYVLVVLAMLGCGVNERYTPPIDDNADVDNCTWCGGACVDLMSSAGNCGACNQQCPSSTKCERGVCVDE